MIRNMPQSQQLTIQQAISRAKKATKQGNTAVAVNLYNAVLAREISRRERAVEVRSFIVTLKIT
jgi:hypothetical protein